MSVIIKDMLASTSSVCRPVSARTGFRGVTIHNTGNISKGADAEAHGKYLQGVGAKEKVSWHYAVDENCAVRSIPEKERAYHAGDGTGVGNYKTIAIEICMNSDGNLEGATNNAAELAADILKRNGVTNAREYIYQHNHWSGKNCPQRIRAGLPYDWDTFVKKVQKHLDGEEEDMTETQVKALIEEAQPKRYSKVLELPTYYQAEVQELINVEALKGDSKGNLNLTEDLIRGLIVGKRYADTK